MAVNEDLYSWMLKTYGMPAAEWYRSNPNNKPGGNPYLPKGAYVPKADIGSDDTYASVSPEFEEVSVTDNSSYSPLQALYDMPEDDYEQYRQSLGGSTYKFDSEEALKQMYPGATYTQKELPRYDNILLTEYGMGFQDIGSGSHYLFNKYLNDPQYRSLSDDYQNRIYPAIQNLSASDYAGGTSKYDALMAEANANTQSQRALAQKFNQLYSGQVVEGWDENAFYAENISLPTRQNLAALIQQSQEGVQSSQDFLDDYVAKGGEGTQPRYGPRGEELGDVAVQYGDGFPKTPGWMKELDRLYKETKDKPFKPGTPKPGRGLGDVWEGPLPGASAPASVDVRVARAAQQSDEQKQKLAQQSEFDMSKEKQLASARAAETYRRGAAAEDPFRAAARMG